MRGLRDSDFNKNNFNIVNAMNSLEDIRLYKVMLVCLLVIVQLFATAMPVFAVSKTENGVTLSVNVDEILEKGEIFTVSATVKNNSGEEISDVRFNISQKDSLFPVGSDWSIPADENIANGGEYTFEAKLVYNGNQDSLQVSFSCSYSEGDPVAISTYLFFESSDNTTPTTPGTNKAEPVLKVKSGISMPVFKAGEDVVLSLPIVNNSIYEAKNISVAIDTSNVNALPFTFDQIALACNIEKIQANKEDKVSYKIKIKPDAKEGLYPITLNYQYYNIYNNSFTSTETIYIKVVNDKTLPKLILGNIQTYSNDPSPGNIMSLALFFKNQGSLPARDIKVDLEGLSSEVVTTYRSAVSKYIQQIDGQGEGKVEYMLIISEKFTGDIISLKAKVEYKDGAGNPYSDEYLFFIRVNQKEEVKEEEAKPEIILRELNFPTSTIQAGEEFDLSFTVENIGKDEARNVKVALTCDTGILPKSMSTVIFDSLEVGQSRDLKFTLFADKGAITKNHLITINIEYEDIEVKDENGDGQDVENKVDKYSLTRYAGVYVEKKEEEDETEEKTVPKIIISRYSFEPGEVKAGQNFKLSLAFLNTSKLLPVRNIKVTFFADEGVFIPTSSSNTFFIESMGIQSIVEREVELYPKSDAAPKSHILNINFEYEDEKGNQYTSSEKISIPVKQEQRLVIGQLSLPQSSMEGQSIPIFLEFYNMGKSTLYNLMVKFEGEGLQAESTNYFAGNFEPGRSDYFESMVTPVATGEVKGTIVFSFEDEAGNKNEMRQEININVMPMERPQVLPEGGEMADKFPGGMPEGEQQKKLLTPLNIGIAGGGLVVIIVVLIIILRKRRIRKAGMTFDE